jgi:hypothetical protein
VEEDHARAGRVRRNAATSSSGKLSITNGPTLSRDAGTVPITYVFEYTGNPDDPVGDFISSDFHDVHGPHPDLVSDFELFCDVLLPYLQDP